MTVARNQQICVEQTPYYHVVSRCVRKAFLCGYDRKEEKDYEHRRQWLIDRIKKVTSLFAIDLCSYAIMSNHFHIVLKVNSTQHWNATQVLMTWCSLYSLPVLCDRYLKGEIETEAELRRVKEYVTEYRSRLMSVSWYMKSINEYVARMANEEDKCTGHFWESRFKSQALLAENCSCIFCIHHIHVARRTSILHVWQHRLKVSTVYAKHNKCLLCAVMRVDLNPIRAAIAKDLKGSEFTSIKERIENTDTWLSGFGKDDNDLPFYLSSYIDLVDETGRCLRNDKRGFISEKTAKAIDEIGIDPNSWIDELKGFKSIGFSAVGTAQQLKEYSKKTKRKWTLGIKLKPALE